MTDRPIRIKTRAAAAAALALVIAGPALADCCDSVFDCAATVVTEGVSCEIQTILDTIRTIQTIVTNVRNDVTGQTQAAESAARQGVTDTYNTMQSQSQQASADMTAALTQATQVYKSETQILAALPTAQVSNRNEVAAGGTSPAPQGPPLTATLNNPSARPGAPQPAASPQSHTMTALRTPAGMVAASGTGPPQTETLNGGASAQTGTVKLAAPHGAYADALARGVKEITTLKGTADRDATTVNQYLAQAQATEGPGVAAADTVAGAMMAPLNALESLFSSMLTNPFSAFDPSPLADSVENTVEANLSSNIGQMVDDISAGPTKAFNAAQPTYDDLLTRSQRAQAIAAAMAQLYKIRTTGAADALYALLPMTPMAGTNTKATVSATLPAQFGQRLSFANVSTRLVTARQHALLAYRAPAANAQLHAAVAQFKAQRAQGRSALPQSALLAVRGTLSQQLDGYFKGKSPAAIAAARDQLIAQTPAHFPSDPKTANAIIALLSSEASSRAGTATLARPGSAAAAVVKSTPTSPSVTQTVVAPAVTMGVARKVATVPVSSAPATPAANTPTWGAAPAWTPAATAPAVTTAPVTTFRSTAQPASQQSTPATAPAAPSSLGR